MIKSFLRLFRNAVPLLAIAVVVVLSGCQTNNYAGSGPLVLSSKVGNYYQKFLDDPQRAAFAVAPSGRCAVFYHCPEVAGACAQNDTQFYTVRSCKDRCGSDCKILADRSGVVWQGPVKGLPEEAQRPQDKANIPAATPKTPEIPPVTLAPVRKADGCTDANSILFDAQPGLEFRDCPECPEMVTIPAGKKTAGSTENSLKALLYKVDFPKPFAVGKYEVTFQEWNACVADSGCNNYKPTDNGWGRGRQPVIYVNWYDAKSYVEWLSEKTGGSYRLLSGAEWESVARAGTCGTFWWGNEVGISNAVCRDCGTDWDYKKPAPVGQFKPNGLGLFDTAGNVSEWVEDCKNSYKSVPLDGSAITNGTCHLREHRGGSWKRRAPKMRPENRESVARSFPTSFTGFRVAKTLP